MSNWFWNFIDRHGKKILWVVLIGLVAYGVWQDPRIFMSPQYRQALALEKLAEKAGV